MVEPTPSEASRERIRAVIANLALARATSERLLLEGASDAARRTARDALRDAEAVCRTLGVDAPGSPDRESFAALDTRRDPFDDVRALSILARRLTPLAAPRRHRLARAAAWVAGLALLGVAIAYGVRVLRPPMIRASATYYDQYSARPSLAVDGDPATEWSAPDGSKAWIELRVSPPRHVETVRVLGGRNLPWGDRVADQIRIELTSTDGTTAITPHAFGQRIDEPQWAAAHVPFDKLAKVRVWLDSWHGHGGGIGEIQLQ